VCGPACADVPETLKKPEQTVKELSGLGPDATWCRQDPSNVIQVGDTYYVWFTKYKRGMNPYSGTISYATSKDGLQWAEQGEALGKGMEDSWDSYGVITPYTAVIDGKFHLFYTATRAEKPWKVRGTLRHIGLATADRPEGPWRRFEGNPVLSPGTEDTAWDSLIVDDTHMIVRDGKFWLYYKGGDFKVTADTTRWGLAIADKITGPYVKHTANPVFPSGHTVCVWPFQGGVAAMVDNAGPESHTIQFSTDGVHFTRAGKVKGGVLTGCGPHDPDAFTNTRHGAGISWGVAQFEHKDGGRSIVRFDMNWQAKPSPGVMAAAKPVGVTVEKESVTEDELEQTRLLVRAARQLRDKFQRDPHRPAYHFVAPEGDCHAFDPNGAIFWKGRYHLFYIFQPGPDKNQPYGFKGSWGHASSVDLLHWRIHPTALKPGEGDSVINSGGAFINKDGVPTIIYSRGNGVCIATSTDDDLEHWTKHPKNPVQLPGGDVHGWLEGDNYYALVGTKLHRSTNLTDWEFLHGLLKSDRPLPHVGEDVSCQDFFPLGDRRVLLFMSHLKGVQYYIGRYQDGFLIPERHGRMNWKGGTLIAPETLLDGKGRRVFWAWACEARTSVAQKAAGWSGVYTLPRILSLEPDGALHVEPADEFEKLRMNHRQRRNAAVAPDKDISFDEIRGTCLELAMDIDPDKAQQVGLHVFASPDGREKTSITFDLAKKTLVVDMASSSLSPDIFYPWPNPWSAHHPLGGQWSKEDVRQQEVPLEMGDDKRLRLRLFLDRSILEIYVNGRQCVTQRVYPTRTDATGVSFFCRGGSAKITSLDAWDMAPSNPW
jgi:beta-fructofuranosidase